jgi:hypothetical protein
MCRNLGQQSRGVLVTVYGAITESVDVEVLELLTTDKGEERTVPLGKSVYRSTGRG